MPQEIRSELGIDLRFTHGVSGLGLLSAEKEESANCAMVEQDLDVQG
jgi:hypothetical protein